jgi:hypothetical protein
MGDDKDFKVSDRRLLTPEGELREDSDAATPREEKAARRDAPAAGESKIDLASFLLSLGAQASVLLGGHEEKGPDFAGAREVISILEMLEDKTAGRRTPDETQILEALLFELRMAYVGRAGGASE